MTGRYFAVYLLDAAGARTGRTVSIEAGTIYGATDSREAAEFTCEQWDWEDGYLAPSAIGTLPDRSRSVEVLDSATNGLSRWTIRAGLRRKYVSAPVPPTPPASPAKP